MCAKVDAGGLLSFLFEELASELFVGADVAMEAFLRIEGGCMDDCVFAQRMRNKG